MDRVSRRCREVGAKSDEERGTGGAETDEEGRIEGMTAFCIITHISLTTLNPWVIFIWQRGQRHWKISVLWLHYITDDWVCSLPKRLYFSNQQIFRCFQGGYKTVSEWRVLTHSVILTRNSVSHTWGLSPIKLHLFGSCTQTDNPTVPTSTPDIITSMQQTLRAPETKDLILPGTPLCIWPFGFSYCQHAA